MLLFAFLSEYRSQGMAIGVPIRYFLLGDEERAQKQLALAKERHWLGSTWLRFAMVQA